jgi:hypothetical protein
MLTFVVDWCVYVWRVASALDFVVFVTTTRRNENMFSPAWGLAVRHSSFVVAYSCCCRCCRCATRYENEGRSRLRPTFVVIIAGVVDVAVARRDVYMPRALALRISSSTYVVVTAVINSSCTCARWLKDSSCACAWWLIARIVVCSRHRTTIQSVKWSSCACAWVAWRRHMMLPQPIGYRCCHRSMRYDNMVLVIHCRFYAILIWNEKRGGCWQHMLLLHPRCCRRRCYTMLVVVKTSRHLCLWANRVVVVLLSSSPVDCRLSLWWLIIYETLVRMRMSG